MFKFLQAATLFFLLFADANVSYASKKALTDFLENTTQLTARFSQVIADESGMTLDRAKGRFYLSRPGRFRWDYQNPDPELETGQQLISDGEHIIMYDPDLEQATKRSLQDALLQVPTLVLVNDHSALEALFDISDYGVTDGQSWVALKPKSEDAAYRQLMLGFEEGTLASINLLDGLGNETRLSLTEVEDQAEIAAEVFVFQPSESTDILEE